MPNHESLAGTLELVVLKSLAGGANHGFGITLHVQATSKGLLHVEEGSLYPALHRMEKAGLVRAEWRTTENGRRARYYSLTAAGRRRLAAAEQSWATLAKGVGLLLRST
jgi:PadR family transcriptional regulator, regulatory protein PadR